MAVVVVALAGRLALDDLVLVQAAAQVQVGLEGEEDSQEEALVEAGSYTFNPDSIKSLIQNIESKTSLEVVAKVVKQSDNYPAVFPRLSLFLFFSAFLALSIFGLHYFLNTLAVVSILITCLLVSFFLSKVSLFKLAFILSKESSEEVRQKALESFFEHNLHSVKTGSILVFFSLLERKVEIIYNHQVEEKSSPEDWSKIISNMSSHLKRKNINTALESAFLDVETLLKEDFPPHQSRKNALSDEVIVE